MEPEECMVEPTEVEDLPGQESDRDGEVSTAENSALPSPSKMRFGFAKTLTRMMQFERASALKTEKAKASLVEKESLNLKSPEINEKSKQMAGGITPLYERIQEIVSERQEWLANARKN
jgi:hypothetical protein